MSRLIKTDDILYESEPFEDFDRDCETCVSYRSGGNMMEGGDCNLHNISCGWGFTCDDYKHNSLCRLNKPHIDFEQ